jgi:RNA polymerase sigma-70 factor (ECF subfamily)
VKGTGVKLQLRVTQGRRDGPAQHAAFSDLHRDHALGVYNLALRLVGDREEARDISQDVLLKAFERLGKPGELHQRAWLYRVTVNACYDHLRSIRRRPLGSAEHPEPVSPVDGFEQAELVRAVEAALRRLPPAQRAALLLREVHGLPTGEVAFALGTTADSAAVTLSRARKTFRRHFLELRGPDDGFARDAPSVGGATAKAGAVAIGLWLPRLHLPQAPLPAGLESTALLGAATTGAGLSAGHGADAAAGIIARLADALCTKAGAVGATATLVTGSIGGAYAVEHAARGTPPVPPSSSPRAAALTSGGEREQAPSSLPSPAPTPTPSESATAEPATARTPEASASPVAAPSTTPTPLVVGESGASPSASPAPQPSPSAEPSATPSPSVSPTPSASPEPTASPTSAPAPQSSPSAAP